MSKRWNFFTEDEVKGMKPETVAKLDWARGRAGVPFRITRGFDTTENNTAVGGVKDSAHLSGHGFDLACSDSVDRFKIVYALLLVGFRRIGVYDRHIHGDDNPSLPPNVMWVGTSK